MSTVILSGVPYSCQEGDIHRALLMYGTAIDIQINQQLQQAFVTMRTQVEAQALLSKQSVNVMGSAVGVTQGPKMNISIAPSEVDSGNGFLANPYSAPPPQTYQTVSVYSVQPSAAMSSPYPSMGSGGYDTAGAATYRPTRLQVTVDDCKFPITREVLTEMFNMIDQPTNVYCGPSGPTTIGSVEFASADSAERAVTQFNLKNIYPGCCLLRLSYAPPPQPAPSMSYRAAPPMQSGGYAASAQQAPMYATPSGARDGYGFDGPRAPPPMSPSPPSPSLALAQAAPAEAVAHGGRGGAGRGGAGRGGGGRGAGGACTTRGFDPFTRPQDAGGVDGHAAHALPPPPSGPTGPYGARRPPPPCEEDGTVIISNVSESVCLYDLWVLLEIYGNVNLLKRHFKDKRNVTAQFQHTRDAKCAIFYLQNCQLKGKPLGLKLFAGYSERVGAAEVNAGPPTDPNTQACSFVTGYHHRTKPSAPFNPRNRIHPDKNIFVSNLIDELTDDEVQAEVAKTGARMEGYYRKTPKSAIIGFADIETAITALVGLHAKVLKGRFLSVTFSRYPPVPRADGERNGKPDDDDDQDGNEESGVAAEKPSTSATPDAAGPEPSVSKTA